MIVSKEWENLYRQIELVQAGERKRRKLCIMSFAALLAGETYSDRPYAVSGLVRCYAVIINDEMPKTLRQDLKPFAPSLLGTNDPYDYDRAALLMHILRHEILPRVEQDFPPHPRSKILCILAVGSSNREGVEVKKVQARLSPYLMPTTVGDCITFAARFAKLLCACGRNLATPSPNWYWAKAIETLDRLCAVRDEHSSQEINEKNVTALVKSLQIPNHGASAIEMRSTPWWLT